MIAMHPVQQRPGAQWGFALLEFAIAALLTLLLAVWASQALVNRIQDASVEAAAQWMKSVERAARTWLERHASTVRLADSPAGLVVPGYVDWQRPSVAELVRDGLLDAGFPGHTGLIGGADIRIMRSGDCPGEACRLDALISSRRPLVRADGIVDHAMLAHWLMATAGKGLTVHPDRPAHLQGPRANWPNPLADGGLLAPGTVALMVTNEELSAFDFLRMRDTRNPDFQADLSVLGNLAAGGDVAATRLRLSGGAQLFTACDHAGAVVQDALGGLLVCHGGTWRSSARSGGAFSTNSRFGCSTPEGMPSHNPATGSCSCPSGFKALAISEGSADAVQRGVTRGFVCVG